MAKQKGKNASDVMALMKKGYALFVTKGYGEAILRPLKGNGATPLHVLIQSAKMLIDNKMVVSDGMDGLWERFLLAGE